MPLGLFEGSEFKLSENSLKLCPGDRLVLYTDGLTDVLAPDERMYGRERLLAHLRGLHTLDSESICQATFSALDDYRQHSEQFDDMTMLVVEVNA